MKGSALAIAEAVRTVVAALACENCGGAVIGRKPNAVFCSTCACERAQASAIERQVRRWARILADPVRHARRNDQKRLREYDRRIEDHRYRSRGNMRLAAWHRHQRRRATPRPCDECGTPLGHKLLDTHVPTRRARRLSNRRLHDECREQRRRQRVVLAWYERREQRVAA